jgi:hypothetical protein
VAFCALNGENPRMVGRVHVGGMRSLLPALRGLLMVFCVLTLLGTGALFFMSERTEEFFAWTIDPPLTAAFMGAGYAAGFVLVAMTLRAREWSYARVAVVTITVFTVFQLIATLLHLDRLHFLDAVGTARIAAWFWLSVYVVIPLALLVLMPWQVRRPGIDPPGHLPLPRWLGAVLAVQGAVMVVVGGTLFVVPTTAATLWSWPLTPLTARSIGSWLIAFGVAAVLALREDDLVRLYVPAIAYTVYGALELVALIRYASLPQWNRPPAWIYLALMLSVTAAGAYGWVVGRREVAARGGLRPAAAPGGRERSSSPG